jgi:hypothetical protein
MLCHLTSIQNTYMKLINKNPLWLFGGSHFLLNCKALAELQPLAVRVGEQSTFRGYGSNLFFWLSLAAQSSRVTF